MSGGVAQHVRCRSRIELVPVLDGGWVMTDDTPEELAQRDTGEAKRELGEAQAMFTVASGFDVTAQVMDTLGFGEAAADAQQAAAAARGAGIVDAIQAMDWMEAATSWGTVADDLKQQSGARGGAYAAGDRALKAEDALAAGGLGEAERTAAEVEAARSRAEEGVLHQRAEELAGSASEAAEQAAMAERAARQLGD
jgi:hypothetical protein